MRLLDWVKYQIRRRSMNRKMVIPSSLEPEDILIDCGANVGDYTEQLAKSGATVYAFEPDPVAFQVLKQRMALYENAHCINKAVSDHNGHLRLFFRKDRAQDTLISTQGSSLEEDKNNIDRNMSVEVEVIDLSEFILGLPREVSVLKMDVEGTEVRILEHFLETGAIDRIRKAYVETHERKLPRLEEPLVAVKAELGRRGLSSRIELDWI